jgi:hypothetical protein
VRFLFFLAFVWLPLAASAQEHPLPRLAWRAPSGCPEHAQVQETVQAWLQQSVDPVDARALAVDAMVERDGERWTLTLLLESPSGRAREEFTAQRCASLVEVVALKVALAAGVAAGGDARPRERSAVELVAMRGLAGVTLGVLPGASSSFELAAALGFSSARVELGVSYAPARVVRYDEPELREIGAELQLFAALLRACARLRLRRAEFPLCGGVELGVLSGRGFGTTRTRTSNQLLGQVVLGPALRVRLARSLFAWLEADALFLFARPAYQVRNLQRLYRPEPVAGRFALGLEWEVW